MLKICGENGSNWRKNLPLVFFTGRISPKRTAGMSPYKLLFGKKAVSPLEIEAATYVGIDWDGVKTIADWVHASNKHLLRREEILDQAFRKMLGSGIGIIGWHIN